MATITNAVMNVNTTFPPEERYIYLTEDDFDGDPGEGDFISGSGADRIPVYNILKRKASTVEIYLREGSGAVGAEYTVTLLINPDIAVYNSSHDREHSPIPFPVQHLDLQTTVTNPANTIEIFSREGQTVSFFKEGLNIRDIQINGSSAGGGTVGNFSIDIR